MATVLLGWELGDGLHHARTLVAVAQSLRAHGHVPILALKNVQEPWALLANEGFGLLQAPFWFPRRRLGEPNFVASTFADILAVHGYDAVDSLLPQVTAWQQLVDLARPQLIVTDYAPTLCLTAFGTLPIVQTGAWFELPPVDADWFPVLMKDHPPVMPQQKILEVVQELQRRRGRPPLERLTAFLDTERFITLLPELDPYSSNRKEPYWDPLDTLPPPTPAPAAMSFFAYLTAENAHIENILTALALTGCPGTVYLRSLGTELAARLRLQGLTVLDRPAPLDTMLARASILVHHGGVGAAQAALTAGRPQLIFPQHLEQNANAIELRKRGLGLYVAPSATPQSITRTFKQLLDDPSFAERATQFAHQFQQHTRRPALEAITSACLRHLA